MAATSALCRCWSASGSCAPSCRGSSPAYSICDHVVGRGVALYEAACRHELEGVVGKWARGVYQCNGSSTSWLKVKNAAYTQMDGRRELFEARRDLRQQRRGQRAPELCLA